MCNFLQNNTLILKYDLNFPGTMNFHDCKAFIKGFIGILKFTLGVILEFDGIHFSIGTII